jgi:hypothetical protein
VRLEGYDGRRKLLFDQQETWFEGRRAQQDPSEPYGRFIFSQPEFYITRDALKRLDQIALSFEQVSFSTQHP